jgi:hypothetical protein
MSEERNIDEIFIAVFLWSIKTDADFVGF